MNIIIKNNQAKWRPLQPTLSHFPSLHKKDSRIVDPSLPVEMQFSPEELRKIQKAALSIESKLASNEMTDPDA